MRKLGGEPLRASRTIDPDIVVATTALLRRRAGLLFPNSRRAALEAAMLRVMQDAGVPDGATLVTLLAEDGAIFDNLVAEVTIGESYFFREGAQFDLIRSEIIPSLTAARPGRRIRAWSAACAAGEEAYSLAITLAEQQVDGEVLGTDISRPRLRAARQGVYRQWAMRGVNPTAIERWFQRDGEQFTVAATARQHTTFRYLNLAEDAIPSLSSGVWGMDLILCRNVLIYFDPPTIERVCRALLAALSDDGWLLLGASDPPLTGFDGAEVIETAAGLAYRRAQPGVTTSRPPAVPTLPAIRRPAPPEQTAAPIAPPIAEPRSTGITPALSTPEALQPDPVRSSYESRDYPTVVQLVEIELSDDGASLEHQILLVRALANLGRLPEAGRACASALDAQRDVAELHYLHSVLLMESGRPSDAAEAAKRALYLDRTMVVAHLAAATAATRAGDVENATRALATAERFLTALRPDSVVPASDGATAGRLLEIARAQRRFLTGAGS